MDNVVFVDFRRTGPPTETAVPAPAPNAGSSSTSSAAAGPAVRSPSFGVRDNVVDARVAATRLSMGQLHQALADIRRNVDALARRTKAVQVEAQQTALMAQDLREQTLEIAEALGELDERFADTTGTRPSGSYSTH